MSANNKDRMDEKGFQSATCEPKLLQVLRDEYGFSEGTCTSLATIIHKFTEEYQSTLRADNQIIHKAVDMHEPPGKSYPNLKLVPVILTTSYPEDAKILKKYGIKGLRQHKLIQFSNEAYEQGGLLIQEDMAVLLTTSSRTIQRDMKELKEKGVLIPTRGTVKENGHIPSNRTYHVQLYLNGYGIEEIATLTCHTNNMVQEHLSEFTDVVYMYRHGQDSGYIQKNTRLTAKVIGEFLLLFKSHYDVRNMKRMNSILTSSTPKLDEHAHPLSRR